MSVRSKFFLILFAAGFAGVLSFLLVDLNGLVAILQLPTDVEIPQITPVFKLLSLVQPSLLLLVAVLAGVLFADQVGLAAPAIGAAARGENIMAQIRPQLIPGLIGGVVGGALIVILAHLWTPFLPDALPPLLAKFGRIVPLATRALYGGITEELLLRWGLMTFLVWLAWKLFQKGNGVPRPLYFAVAIVVSSLVFGLGHLPVAFLLFPQPGVSLILFVVVANSVFGLIAGYLFWKKGLESAMIAHVSAHMLMFAASSLGAYF